MSILKMVEFLVNQWLIVAIYRMLKAFAQSVNLLVYPYNVQHKFRTTNSSVRSHGCSIRLRSLFDALESFRFSNVLARVNYDLVESCNLLLQDEI